MEQKSKPAHGKQTMRQLRKQNAGVSNSEITDSNIKAFESTAKKSVSYTHLGRINTRLLCEMMSHEKFAELMADFIRVGH